MIALPAFRPRAFTLIELLVVVAVIAILAAIAVPNFLEARTRSVVARVKSDLRTLATAVEAYAADANAFPPHRLPGGVEVPYPDRYHYLTTPVAYLSGIPDRDPFHREDVGDPGGSERWYSWTNFGSFDPGHPLFEVRELHRYMLRSRGPDGQSEPNPVRNDFMTSGLAAAPSFLYDPTNGTISRGDIVRTTREIP